MIGPLLLPAARALRRALAGPTPVVPSRWFWDARGGQLHRDRAQAPAYYPARVERELYEAHAPVLVGLFEPREVAELAPGASRNVRVLLDALLRHGAGIPARGCAILDADPARLAASVRTLAADYPRLSVRGEVGEWHACWRLGPGGGRLVLLSGPGPDGLDPGALPATLRALAASFAPGDTLVLGVDRGRDPDGLLRACADPEGRAAAFHLNALRAINARLGADFDPDGFAFEARWDGHAVETALRPLRPMRVGIAGEVVALDPGRPLVTGRVGTWTRAALREQVEAADLELCAWLTDPDDRRALAVLRRAGAGRVEGDL
jgi:L-histidine N-alpha-methyltransferase